MLIFLDKQLVAALFNLFNGGTETTVSTLRWAILLMAKYPEVQKKVQKEIDTEIGAKSPEISDKSKLKFTDAVLFEVQRVASLDPSEVHRVTKTVTIRGYTIPKDSIALLNFFAVHRDKRIWKDPEYFHVENFYDEEKKSIKNTDRLIHFGLGLIIFKY